MSVMDLNVALCEALGIDPKEAIAVNIKIRIDSYPQVFVKRLIRSGDFSHVTQAFELRERKT